MTSCLLYFLMLLSINQVATAQTLELGSGDPPVLAMSIHIKGRNITSDPTGQAESGPQEEPQDTMFQLYIILVMVGIIGICAAACILYERYNPAKSDTGIVMVPAERSNSREFEWDFCEV